MSESFEEPQHRLGECCRREDVTKMTLATKRRDLGVGRNR